MTLTIKKIAALVIIGILFTIIGWVLPLTTTTGVQWVVNNTNKGPIVAGHGGTGERIGDNTTYWANSSPIQIFLYSHANTTGTAAEIHLFINGTKVSDTSGRPLGVAETSNRSIVATIPQYANYSVEMVNFHHYEWYEYPILTGTVTTTVVSSGGGTTGAGCVGDSGNCSFNQISVNSIKTNTSTQISLNSVLTNTSSLRTNVFSLIYPLQLRAQDTTTGHYSDLFVEPDTISMVFTNGTQNRYTFNISASGWHGLNATEINYTKTNHIIAAKTLNETRVIPDDATGTGSDYLGQLTSENNAASFTFSTYSTSTSHFNVFSAFKFNGTPESYHALSKDNTIFFIGARGSTADGSYYDFPATSASKAALVMRTANTWNSTSNPTAIDFATTANVSTSRVTAVTIESSGNMTFKKSDSGITLKSPDSNDWCVKVSNAGALTITAGKCVQ